MGNEEKKKNLLEYFDSLERIFFFFFSVLKRRADSLQPVRPPDLHIHNVLALFFFSNFWRICIQMTKKKGEEEEEESRPPKTRFSFDFVWCETSHSNTSSPSGVVIARFNHTPHPTTSFSSTPPPPTKPHNQPPAVLHFFSFLLLLLLSNTWFFTHVQLVFFSCFFSRSNRIIERKKKSFPTPRTESKQLFFLWAAFTLAHCETTAQAALCCCSEKKFWFYYFCAVREFEWSAPWAVVCWWTVARPREGVYTCRARNLFSSCVPVHLKREWHSSRCVALLLLLLA